MIYRKPIWLAALGLASLLRAETPAPPAMVLVPQMPSLQTGSTINVFDNSVFDGVGKPSKLDQQLGTGEYTSADYQDWLRACDSKKEVSMQAYRDCVEGMRQRSATALKERERRVQERSQSLRPPSPLDEPTRAPSGNSDAEPDSD